MRALVSSSIIGSAVVLLFVGGTSAHAEPTRCKSAIVRTSTAFVQSKANVLANCERNIVGKLPPSTDCHSEPKTAAAIAKAEARRRSIIAKACGGDDGVCGTPDGDDAPAAIGWPGVCPNFESGGCTNAISNCTDIADCLACISETAVDQAIGLYYDAFVPSDPKSAVNRCQREIGRSTTQFLRSKSRALAQCWTSVNLGRATAPCPVPGDGGKAAQAIARAEARKQANICHACGGLDESCDGQGDLSPAAIGFVSSCPAVTVPGAGSCAAAVNTLEDLVACVDCVTEFKVDCTDRAAVPWNPQGYPPECNPGAAPTPTRTPTSTPTRTPTGVVTPTRTATPTITATNALSATPTVTRTTTPTVTATNVLTATPTTTRTATPTVTVTNVLTATPTTTRTATPTVTATNVLTATPTTTRTATPTVTATNVLTATPTATRTATPTVTATNVLTATPTATRTATPTVTATGVVTATRTVTPTPTPTRTATPTITATVVAATVTRTPTPTVTATVVAATATRTPTPTVTATPGSCGNGVLNAGEDCDPAGGAATSCQNASNTAAAFTCNASTCQCACPTKVTFTGNAADPVSILDTGWTGISHRAPIISNGEVTVGVSGCTGSSRPCGTCSVSGPLPNPNAGAGQLSNQRCTNDTSIKCTSNAPCTAGGGTCQFFFGSNLPLAAGGVTTCVVNQFNGPVSGTANIESGEAVTNAFLTSRVYNGIAIDNPCPRCSDTGGINDGVNGGTCDGGPRVGLTCDANGTVPGRPDFGRTSLDCPPNAAGIIATLPIDLSNATDPVVRTVTASSPGCSGEPGEKCLCDTCNNVNAEPCDANGDCPDPAGPIGPICGGKRCIGGTNNGAACTATSECPGMGICGKPGEPTKPSACLDDTSTPGVLDCADLGTGEGQCTQGPITQSCSVASGHAQRGCSSDTDCGGGAGSCQSTNRLCFLTGSATGFGKVGTTTLIANGMEDTPMNDTSQPTLGAVFCVGPTSAGAVNNVAGLPGPSRVTIRGTATALP